MTSAENRNYSRDIVVRISPERNTLTVEEQKPGGIVAMKRISPLDLYFSIYGSYFNRDMLSSGFLPENCLHIAMDRKEKIFTIWHPELYTDVAYGEKEYLKFPIPRLVFGIRLLETGRIADCSLGVVADEKPTPETPMFHYPFSNVHPNSMVCTGNNVLPKYKKQTALWNFPRYLLGLPDNDDMYDPKNNKLQLSHSELLEHLKDKDPAYYYSDVLVPNGKTLQDFISRR